MRVAVDAMGGDYGPAVTIEGALGAVRDFGLEVVLVGEENLINRELRRLGGRGPAVTVADAPEAIGMGEGVFAFRRKRKSSIRIGMLLVKEGEADAFVSAGNTAAVVAVSQKILGPLGGVERPALALLVPTLAGSTLLIDIGANANCRPRHLEQFAVMGRIVMESVLGRRHPRVGLMSIGEERGKGNDLVRTAHEILARSPLNFIGNVEGKDLFSGKADVVVCDGFTGNVVLKAAEGIVENLLAMARRDIGRDFGARVGFFLMKRQLKRLYRKLDYAQYGGAPLLGLDGVCVVGHGRSSALAVKNAVRMAREYVRSRVTDKIRSEIGGLVRPVEHAGGAT
ncbi:MAG: phosphate acyltransferase PlsX [Candidatus Aminicenantes bacterium]|nr:phosphate acyltransferase PlsX [Candidatus Aminicenantes bacterium]